MTTVSVPGHALSHAYGAAFDNPDLLVMAVDGDGEAETGPLVTSEWQWPDVGETGTAAGGPQHDTGGEDV